MTTADRARRGQELGLERALHDAGLADWAADTADLFEQTFGATYFTASRLRPTLEALTKAALGRDVVELGSVLQVSSSTQDLAQAVLDQSLRYREQLAAVDERRETYDATFEHLPAMPKVAAMGTAFICMVDLPSLPSFPGSTAGWSFLTVAILALEEARKRASVGRAEKALDAARSELRSTHETAFAGIAEMTVPAADVAKIQAARQATTALASGGVRHRGPQLT